MQLDKGLCLLVQLGKHLFQEEYRRYNSLISVENQRFCRG
jgi:hypothetical protein